MPRTERATELQQPQSMFAKANGYRLHRRLSPLYHPSIQPIFTMAVGVSYIALDPTPRRPSARAVTPDARPAANIS